MRKSVFSVAAVICLVLTMAWGLAVAQEEEMCVPMGEIPLESLSASPQRTGVSFPHSLHFSNQCQTCHHEQDRTEPVVGCTTAGCHDLDKAPRTKDGLLITVKAESIRYYKNAFHEMCIGCHKQIKQENKAKESFWMALDEQSLPAGPTGCIECHPQE